MENNTTVHVQEKTNNKWKIAAIIFIAVSVVLTGLSILFAISDNKENSTNRCFV